MEGGQPTERCFFHRVPMVRIHVPPAESRCKHGFLSVLGRKPAAQPDIDLKKQMRDAFPGAPKTEVGEVIVRATFIGGDLSVEPNSETRIGVDEGVHLTRTMLTSMSLVHAFANRRSGPSLLMPVFPLRPI